MSFHLRNKHCPTLHLETFRLKEWRQRKCTQRPEASAQSNKDNIWFNLTWLQAERLRVRYVPCLPAANINQLANTSQQSVFGFNLCLPSLVIIYVHMMPDLNKALAWSYRWICFILKQLLCLQTEESNQYLIDLKLNVAVTWCGYIHHELSL